MVKIITSSSDIVVSLDTQHYIPGTMRKEGGDSREERWRLVGKQWGECGEEVWGIVGKGGESGGESGGYWKERERIEN